MKSPDKKLKKKLTHWWGIYRMIEDEFWENIKETEKKMAKDTGIKDIEFFFNDGFAVGIGNSSRTIKLIQAEELESK
jgi:hypothetical protein